MNSVHVMMDQLNNELDILVAEKSLKVGQLI